MKIRVEVADTPYKLAQGLMHRTNLPTDAGMLFMFCRPQVLKFWGVNTLIPLDIAFIDSSHKIASIGRINKLDHTMVTSKSNCVMAVEVNAGFFKQFGVGVGDSIKVGKDQSGATVVQFEKNAGSDGSSSEQQVKVAVRGKKMAPPPPFSNTEIARPDWMDDADDMLGRTPEDEQDRNNAYDSFNADDSGLPEVSLSDIGYADDDEFGDNEYGGEEGGENEPYDYEDQKSQEAIQPSDGEPVPDANQMDTGDAVRKAIEEGWVLWINYTTLPMKRTIGPLVGSKNITRIVQPHGIYHARTTHNTILVTWDLSMNDFRAFVLDRIHQKGFTGQRFKRWFRVRE